MQHLHIDYKGHTTKQNYSKKSSSYCWTHACIVLPRKHNRC